MDELNQIQNMPPAGMPPVMPSQGQPMNMMPQGKKGNSWFWVAIFIILAIGGAGWWYVTKMMVVETPLVQQPNIDKEAREDAILNGQIQGANLGNIDNEFKPVDGDLNSL